MKQTLLEDSRDDLLREAQEFLVTLDNAFAHYSEGARSLSQRLLSRLQQARKANSPEDIRDEPSSISGGSRDAYVPDVR